MKHITIHDQAYEVYSWAKFGDAVFELSKDYKVLAFDDGTVNQKNIIHDGTFVLVDGKRRIRGYYDGLSVRDTKRLILDINKLIKEEDD